MRPLSGPTNQRPPASTATAPRGPPTPGSTIFDYCAAIGSDVLTEADAIPIDLFIDYGLWFAERHVPDVEPESVVGLTRAGPDFDVRLSSGEEIRAESVVVAVLEGLARDGNIDQSVAVEAARGSARRTA